MRPCGVFGLPTGGISPPAPAPAALAAIGSTGFGASLAGPLQLLATLLPVPLPVIPAFALVSSPLFQLGDSTMFTQSNGVLKYVGPTARIFQVDAQLNASIPGSESPTPIFMAIFKNGVIAHSYAFSIESIAEDGQSMSVTDTILLQRNDELSIRVAAAAPGVTIAIASAQLSAAA